MNPVLLKLYHRLPPLARFVSASLHGYSLRSWRYGPDAAQRVAAAIERERWRPEQWKAWQEERLAYVLHRAATRVPFYREQWEERRRRGDSASWERLENWPILEKETVRAAAAAFVADDRSPRRMARLHTSGTTGKPLDLWATRDTERAWWALFDARWQHWYGIARGDRGAVIGGKPVAPVAQRRPPFWVWDGARSLLYLSTYHLAPDLTPYYLDALRRYRIRYLRGYTSSLYTLAQEALRLGRRDLPMVVAVTYAEPLLPHQRQTIAEAFQCPVRETYGMVEMTAAASECEAGRLHLWPEAGWIEVLSGGQRAAPGVAGDLVCTGLLNADMPLIRYRVGDSVVLPESDTACSCGRTLPLLESVQGRLDDVVYTADGRRLGCLDVVHAGMAVREAQVVQEAPERLRVRYVPAPEFTTQTGRAIIDELRSQMGDVEVILEEVDEVPRGANGKFRMIVCDIPPAERDRGRSGSSRAETSGQETAVTQR